MEALARPPVPVPADVAAQALRLALKVLRKYGSAKAIKVGAVDACMLPLNRGGALAGAHERALTGARGGARARACLLASLPLAPPI